MKQIIKIFLLYFLVFGIPLPFFYSIMDIRSFLVFSAIYAVIVAINFIFVDKFLLRLLNTKEVIESEKDEIFQMIKHESFKNSVKPPKIYSYRGQIPRIFLLKGSRGYSLVFEEKIFKELTNEEISSFVNFLLINDRKGNSQLLSIAYLLGATLIKNIFRIKNLTFKITRHSDFSKAMFLSLLFFIKPFLIFIFWLALETDLNVSDNDKEFYLKSGYLKLFSLKITESFADNFFVINKLVDSTSKVVDVKIIEVFPASYSYLKKFYA